MAKDKKDKKKKNRSKATADPTIYIVQKHGLKGTRIDLSTFRWVAVDGKNRHRGYEIVWEIPEKTKHDLKINPPKIVESLKIEGNCARAVISDEAETGYYEYTITVDGEPVEGGSAPGIIIE